jgi:hypothetical protein
MRPDLRGEPPSPAGVVSRRSAIGMAPVLAPIHFQRTARNDGSGGTAGAGPTRTGEERDGRTEAVGSRLKPLGAWG